MTQVATIVKTLAGQLGPSRETLNSGPITYASEHRRTLVVSLATTVILIIVLPIVLRFLFSLINTIFTIIKWPLIIALTARAVAEHLEGRRQLERV